MSDRSPIDRANPPWLLRPIDLAALLGQPSEEAARELIAREGVPHIRIAGRLYVLRSTLLKFMKAREESRPPPRTESREGSGRRSSVDSYVPAAAEGVADERRASNKSLSRSATEVGQHGRHEDQIRDQRRADRANRHAREHSV